MKNIRYLLSALSKLTPESAIVSESLETVGEIAFSGMEAAAETGLKNVGASELASAFKPFNYELTQQAWHSGVISEMNKTTLENVKKQIENAKDWIRDVNVIPNPNGHLAGKEAYIHAYRPWEGVWANNYNTGSCALAVERRLSGKAEYLAERASIRELPDSNSIDFLEKKLDLTARYVKIEEVADMLKKKGPGAHLVIGATKKPYLPELSGQKFKALPRWFNVYYDGEKIYTLDGLKGYVQEGLFKQYKGKEHWLVLEK